MTNKDKIDSITGWYDWQPFYKKIAKEIKPGDTFAEVGVYHGRSLIHLCSYLDDLNKLNTVNIDAIDNFSYEIKLDTVVHNFARFDLLHYVNIIEASSRFAYRFYEKESIFAAMIDGDHSYIGAYMDVLNFYKRIKVGGYLLVHDYNNPTSCCDQVPIAVDNFIFELNKLGCKFETQIHEITIMIKKLSPYPN